MIRIKPLTSVGTQGLDVVPSPRRPITDDAAAYLLFRNDPGLFPWLEGLTERSPWTLRSPCRRERRKPFASRPCPRPRARLARLPLRPVQGSRALAGRGGA